MDATADVRMIEAINYVPTALHIRSYAKTIADLSYPPSDHDSGPTESGESRLSG